MHVDLNLLVALDALLEENSVAAAAERLHLSPPAMSRTLARIRRATGDEILVRTGRTMTPTPRALELREETRELVRRAAAVLTPVRELDLATLDRTFTIRCHDALVFALARTLTAAVERAAPGVRIRLLAEPAGDVADLARGHTDLEIGGAEPTRPEIATENLGGDRLVLVCRATHPLADGDLTPERLAEADHVTVSRRGRLHDPIDARLAELGLRRRVIAALPTSAAALELAASSSVVTVVPEQVCRPVWARLGLRARPLPFELPTVPVIVAWHHRYDGDSAHVWLRDQVRDGLLSVLGTPTGVIVDPGVEFPVPGPDERWTVAAVILDHEGRAFAQKRSPDRRLFADTWDVAGGHVEPGESLLAALGREIAEETGWRLRRVRRLLGVVTWTGDDGGGLRHEADFLVEVDGDLTQPRLEWGKHTEYDWFGPADLERLKENRPPDEQLIHDLIRRALG